ncbi:hypothetical protein LFT48_06765 [Arthrobacter sp. FW305-123]|nr:hypothetical protein LFT48_06765 [Arthrobacter sp. FW305-123]
MRWPLWLRRSSVLAGSGHTGRGDLIRELIPLRREDKPGYCGMDFPNGPLIERDLTPNELDEEVGQ